MSEYKPERAQPARIERSECKPEREDPMSFKIGDAVQVQNNNRFCRGRGLVQKVLPPSAVAQDFQEYVVEFVSFRSERFRFGLCREFEMQADTPICRREKE